MILEPRRLRLVLLLPSICLFRNRASCKTPHQRSAVERANSNLKDNYGGRFIRVRGAAKVMAHLMFGVIALTAAQLCRLIG
jgi:hypothetical protein